MSPGVAHGSFDLDVEQDGEEDDAPPLCGRSHPLWAAQWTPPAEPEALSLWLAARLPLTTRLRMHVLQCTCPLKRMRDVVRRAHVRACGGRAAARRRALHAPDGSRPVTRARSTRCGCCSSRAASGLSPASA